MAILESRNARTVRPLLGFVLVLLLFPASRFAGASSPQLDSISLSFPTPQVGYVLSLYDCAAKTCAALRSTHDAGSSWDVAPLPRQLQQDLQIDSWDNYPTAYAALTVHFADASNGWIYGLVPVATTPTSASSNVVSRVWSTHNGGRTWNQVHLGPLTNTGGQVVQMATNAGRTYLFGASFQHGRAYLLTTRSNSDTWKGTANSFTGSGIPAGGTQLEASFTFSGSSGWFVAGNDRGYTASARLLSNGSWGTWKGPSFEKFGPSFTPISAVNDRVLLAEGESAGFVYPPASSVPPGWNDSATWLFISNDAGVTFKPFRQLSNSYHATYSTGPGLPATPSPGTILLQRSSGSDYHLVRTTNWGRTWQVVLAHSTSQVIFTSRTTGYAIVQDGSTPETGSLYRTIDAGSRWDQVIV